MTEPAEPDLRRGAGVDSGASTPQRPARRALVARGGRVADVRSVDRPRRRGERVRRGAPRGPRDRDPERAPPAADRGDAPAAHAAGRVRARARARRADAARCRRHHRRRLLGGLVRVCTPCRARSVRGRRSPRRGPGDERRRYLHVPRDSADRPSLGRAGAYRCARSRLPRDRRARAARASPSDARRKRPDDGRLARRRLPPAHRVGDRPLIPDGGVPGRDPARLQRGHSRLPLGREGDGNAHDLLGAARLRRDRAPARHRDRPPDRRGGEPRQPPLGGGRPHDPDGQQDRGREAVESGVPGVPRERVQRDEDPRPDLLGGRPRDARGLAAEEPRRASARASRRHLSPAARRPVRLHPGSHRVRRPDRHDEGPARGLRDVLELRRGSPPLRARARGHARGLAQARRALRAHRSRPPLRRASIRDRGAVGPRPDAGRDVQAAQRLRARRPRAALARERQRHRDRRRRRAELDGRPRPERGDGQEERSGRRTTSRTSRWSSSGRETSGSST